MSKKPAKRRRSEQSVERTNATTPFRWDYLMWASGSFLVLLASTPLCFVLTVNTLPAVESSILGSAHAWNPLLSYVEAVPRGLETRFHIHALATSILIGVVAWRLVKQVHPVIALAFIVGICLIPMHGQVLALLSAITAQQIRLGWMMPDFSLTKSWTRVLGLATIVFVAAMALTLEFSIATFVVTIGLLYAVLQRESVTTSWSLRGGVVVAWVLIVLAPGLVAAGYYAALFRPLTAVWSRAPAELCNSLQPVWLTSDFGWPHLLVMGLIVERWRRLAMRPPASIAFGVELLCFTIFTIGCGRYFWLGSLAIAITTPQTQSPIPAHKYSRLAPTICLGIGVLLFAKQCYYHAPTLVATTPDNRSIDPLAWDIRGPVMLTNLDQSSQWQSPSNSDQLPLLVSDRWDVHGSIYTDYAAACRDWKTGLREAYVRADGTMGGFGRPFATWQPAIVVVDTSDVESLRQLSFDKTWKVLGIDGDRLLFADSKEEIAKPQIAVAGQLLSLLELRRPSGNVNFERVLRLGTPEDTRRAAFALTALRYPYSALRIQPPRDARAAAYLELAHRAKRNIGRTSLIDQTRGVVLLNRLSFFDDVPYATRQRLKHAAETLANRDDAVQVTLPQEEVSDNAFATLESDLRELLGAGNCNQARTMTKKLSNDARYQFYMAIADAPTNPSTTTIERLKRVSGMPKLPSSLRAECLFYLGSLGIEQADYGLTVESFQAIDRQSPYSDLAILYLVRLGVQPHKK